jgi:hypothetical protein
MRYTVLFTHVIDQAGRPRVRKAVMPHFVPCARLVLYPACTPCTHPMCAVRESLLEEEIAYHGCESIFITSCHRRWIAFLQHPATAPQKAPPSQFPNCSSFVIQRGKIQQTLAEHEDRAKAIDYACHPVPTLHILSELIASRASRACNCMQTQNNPLCCLPLHARLHLELAHQSHPATHFRLPREPIPPFRPHQTLLNPTRTTTTKSCLVTWQPSSKGTPTAKPRPQRASCSAPRQLTTNKSARSATKCIPTLRPSR